MNSTSMAQGLAWFGICLGAAELLAPKKVARITGLDNHVTLIRAYGAREIASGLYVLASKQPEQALWSRVAGDGLDAALLASGMKSRNPRRARTFMAAFAVAPVVMLDYLYARSAGNGTG
jgi:hypothetical protein